MTKTSSVTRVKVLYEWLNFINKYPYIRKKKETEVKTVEVKIRERLPEGKTIIKTTTELARNEQATTIVD